VSAEGEPALRLEEHRPRLLDVASRILGSAGSADGAVSETWRRSGPAPDPDELGARLTAELARVCLEMLRRRTSDADAGAGLGDAVAVAADALAGSAPAERVAFVLHDRCAVPLEEVAAILGRTPTATRQLAGRARHRVQSPERSPDADRTVHGRVVDAFLTASQAGDLDELVWLLHPDAVLHATAGPDADAVRLDVVVRDGVVVATRGAQPVAEAFLGRARAARPVLLDGFAAAARLVGGQPREVFGFTVVDGRIAEVELITEPEVLDRLDLTPVT
jgi:DNA-directed RNA polymerase specialized sigma24 family protein